MSEAEEAGPDAAPHVILDLYPRGRAAMQRDMDLIRRIVLAVQAKGDLMPRKVEIDGPEPWVLARHVELLYDAGMLDGTKTKHPVSGEPPTIFVRDLSGPGHDFAAALANDTVWGQIKQKVTPGELAAMPLKVIKDVGVAALQAWLLGRLGLSS